MTNLCSKIVNASLIPVVYIIYRACKQISYVSDVANGIQETSDFKSFLTIASNTYKNLRCTIDKREKNKNLLQTTRTQMTSSFSDIKKKLDQFIDNKETLTTVEMEKRLSILLRKIQFDTDTCSGFEKEIRSFLDDINNIGSQCDEFAFQCFKRYMRKLSSAEQLLSSMEDEDYLLKFTPDTRIQIVCLLWKPLASLISFR